MLKYGYLVVEGPHDTEFLYRLLNPFGLRRVRHLKDLTPVMERLVIKEFPYQGDLQKRMPTPLFLQSDTHAVAIHCANGDTQLAETLEETKESINLDFAFEAFTGVGIFLDADNVTSPVLRFKGLKTEMEKKGFQLPDTPGGMTAGTPKLGAYVFPDNQTAGTLEDLLLECGRQIYLTLLESAQQHVQAALADQGLNTDDRRDLIKPAGQNKAIIGAMASILRPGKSVQVSIQDNRWLRGNALKLPKIKAVQDFLVELLDLR